MRKLIVMAGVLVLLAIGFAVISTSTDPAVTGKLFEISDSEDIDSITVTNSYGTFGFKRIDGDWMVSDGNSEYRASDEKMVLMLAALENFEVSRMLEQGNEMYGLDNPYALVSVNMKDGKTHAISVGNTTVSANDNYVQGEVGIGVTAAANVAQFDSSLTAYRDKNVFTVDVASLEQIGYYKDGELLISLVQGPDRWGITYPFESDARSILMQEFLAMMTGWTVAGFPDTTQISVEEMGFEQRGEALYLVDEMGNTQTIEFGAESGTGTFLRTGGEEDVAVLYTADIDLSTMNPIDMMFVSPLSATHEEVSVMDINIGEQTYKIEVDEAVQSASINGRLIEFDAFAAIFFEYITMLADGVDMQGKPGELVATLTTTRTDGGTQTLSLYARDEQTYFMDFGEDIMFYLDADRLYDLQTEIENVLG